MPETNEHLIQITGKACIPVPLEKDKDYLVIAETSCYADKNISLQNGEQDTIYSLRMFGQIKVIEQGKSPYVGKSKKGSPAQMLRYAVRREWQQNASAEDEEEYYERRIKGFIREIEDKLEH